MSTAAAVVSQDTSVSPDFEAIKQRQRGTWGSGDYSAVGVTLQIVGERLCEALDLHAGERVLDVAAGNGNVSLAAARRFCEVTSTDYVESLLERGRERAVAEHLRIDFQHADAEALPFEAASFDAVSSSFGVMFTPNQQAAAAEMLRVCKPGGRIGLANWTPGGMIGGLFRTIGGFVPPPAGVESPALWGTAERLQDLFGQAASELRITPQTFAFRYRSVDHWLDLWRAIYGPMHKAFESLDANGQEALASAIKTLVNAHNTASDGTMVAHADYLEVVVTKRAASH